MPWWLGLLIGIAAGVLAAVLFIWLLLSKTFRDF
jgi:hypothetical protein